MRIELEDRGYDDYETHWQTFLGLCHNLWDMGGAMASILPLIHLNQINENIDII